MRPVCLWFVLVGFVAGPASAAEGTPSDALERCLLNELGRAGDATTVAQIRAACAISVVEPASATTPATATLPAVTATPASTPAVVTRRPQVEASDYGKQYAITAHRPNYLLPLSYDTSLPNSEVYLSDGGDPVPPQKIEVKYQISFKVPIYANAFGGAGSFFGAYTQRSFWQMYNNKVSKPFRETNYEPELWYQYPVERQLLGWNLALVTLGLDHQSNGRSKEYSRSWNRIVAELVFERGDYTAMIRPWWRLPEKPASDDNPDIGHYMGSFDFTLVRRYGAYSFELMLRNNLKPRDNRGAVQFGWSFPLPATRYLRGYVQLFSGYGESLIDYKRKQNSIGLGLQLVDW